MQSQVVHIRTRRACRAVVEDHKGAEVIAEIGKRHGELDTGRQAIERGVLQFIDGGDIEDRQDRTARAHRKLIAVELINIHRYACHCGGIAGINRVRGVAGRDGNIRINGELQLHRGIHDVRVNGSPVILIGIGKRYKIFHVHDARSGCGNAGGCGNHIPVRTIANGRIRRHATAVRVFGFDGVQKMQMPARCVDADIVLEIGKGNVAQDIGDIKIRERNRCACRIRHGRCDLQIKAHDQADITRGDADLIRNLRWYKSLRKNALQHLDGICLDGCSCHCVLLLYVRLPGLCCHEKKLSSNFFLNAARCRTIRHILIVRQDQVSRETRNENHRHDRKPVDRFSQNGIVQHALGTSHLPTDELRNRTQDEKSYRTHQNDGNPIGGTPSNHDFISHTLSPYTKRKVSMGFSSGIAGINCSSNAAKISRSLGTGFKTTTSSAATS